MKSHYHFWKSVQTSSGSQEKTSARLFSFWEIWKLSANTDFYIRTHAFILEFISLCNAPAMQRVHLKKKRFAVTL